MNQAAAQNAKTPLVTIAVPTLNGTDYLRETLTSLLAQDYPNLDILVSDNGSTDDSLALASAVAQDDRRVRFRRNEVTMPITSTARTKFWTLLSGEFTVLRGLWPISSAPKLYLGGASSRLPCVIPTSTSSCPRNMTIDANGSTIREYSVPEHDVVDGFQFVSDWLYVRGLPKFACVGTVLLRTATVRKFGGYQNFARGQNIDNLVLLQCALGNRSVSPLRRYSNGAYTRRATRERSVSGCSCSPHGSSCVTSSVIHTPPLLCQSCHRHSELKLSRGCVTLAPMTCSAGWVFTTVLVSRRCELCSFLQ